MNATFTDSADSSPFALSGLLEQEDEEKLYPVEHTARVRTSQLDLM